jgi:hypothetical protein
MLRTTEIPQYVHPDKLEHGESFSLDFDTYRSLCRCSLHLFRSLPHSQMAISKGEESACVDIWSSEGSYSIEVSSKDQTLTLYFAEMDSPLPPSVIFTGNISRTSWESIRTTALAYR